MHWKILASKPGCVLDTSNVFENQFYANFLSGGKEEFVKKCPSVSDASLIMCRVKVERKVLVSNQGSQQLIMKRFNLKINFSFDLKQSKSATIETHNSSSNYSVGISQR